VNGYTEIGSVRISQLASGAQGPRSRQILRLAAPSRENDAKGAARAPADRRAPGVWVRASRSR
jgi:hypothetical protein